MDEVEDILQKNSIEAASIEEADVGPEESRKNYVINSESGKFYLSFPLDRDVPVGQRSVKQKIYGEVYSFSRIQEETSLRVPEVVDYSKEYVLMKEITGKRSIEEFKDADRQRQKKIASDLGSALSEIHSVQQPEIGYFGPEGVEDRFESWREFFSSLVSDVVENSETGLEEKAAEYLENNLDSINLDISPVLVYGDFQPWNTLSEERESLGVIDGESAFSGHREYDLAQAAVAWSDKFNVTESFLESYRKEVDLEEGWRERHDYYKVYLFSSAMMDAREIGWEDLVEEFEERLDNLLAELV